MTPKQDAVLAYRQYEAGLGYGREIARFIISKYPDGFDDSKCTEIAASVEASLQRTLNELAGANVAKRHRESFSAGYFIGVRSDLSRYQETLLLRAIG